MSSNLLVLDTHIWIWLLNGDVDQLSEDGLKAIAGASESGQIGVCAISVWEVGMLEAKGRLRLSQGCLDWVRTALSAPGIRLLELTPEIAIESSRLPGEIHGDPADRMLAATARILNGTLVTKDQKLLDYGAQSYLSVIEG
ncbi:MAG: type II toxin-antitoxin system VapC family toxin [Acaryochloridaceae cyanobacterium RL_2_7]|nr:type II toxin-antitoxin system VapC family toxin [Acaryochloridaceae cyanobacterium RL_2_7]